MTKKNFNNRLTKGCDCRTFSTLIICNITPFDGDPKKVKRKVKDVGKYAIMSGNQNYDIPMLTYTCITSMG